MKRFAFLVSLLFTSFVFYSFASCKEEKEKEQTLTKTDNDNVVVSEKEDEPKGDSSSTKHYGSKRYKFIKVKNGASVKGTVLFKGDTIPEPEKVAITKDEFIPHCGKEKETEVLLVNKTNKGIKNAVIRIEKISEGKDFDNSLKEAVLDQKGCIFSPHIVLIAQNGTLKIKNSDNTFHNVHFMCKMNEGINEVQPENTELKRELKFNERIDVKCDVHPWMSAYIFVVEHPYYVVTDENGAYELKDIPAGKYTLRLWHEKLDEKTAEVNIEANKTTDLNFELESK